MAIRDTKTRLFLAAFFITCFAGLLIARLFFIQVVSDDYYQSLAERQHVASQELTPRRGDIYIEGSEGEPIALATTKTGYMIALDARKITDPSRALSGLKNALEETTFQQINTKRFLRIAKAGDDPFEIVLSHLDEEQANQVRDADIAGMSILPDEWRSYPLDSFAAHVTGFYGFAHNGKVKTGQYGIERAYDERLTGNAGFRKGITSSGGVFLHFGKQLFTPPSEGEDITLTIDFEAQEQLEQVLDAIMESFSPDQAGGIIIDPQTGEIQALAARPAFNPNSYGETEDISYFVNPLVSSIFEMGSIMKPLTMAAAIDAGAVTPDTTYYDKGYTVVGGERIENYDGEGRGTVDMQEVLNQSLNTGAVFVAKQLGNDAFFEYIKNFGFSEKTGIRLPAEATGDIRNLRSGRDIEFAAASFGQGIAVTPLAFVRAAAALANGGVLPQLYLVEERRQDVQNEHKQIFRRETSQTISRMLSRVVDDALLGGGRGPEHYTVAAKTGTAQIPHVNASGYSDAFLHSFFGYAPAFDAEFLIFLFAKNPKGVRYASQSLGQPFLDLTNFLLYHYEIPPDR